MLPDSHFPPVHFLHVFSTELVYEVAILYLYTSSHLHHSLKLEVLFCCHIMLQIISQIFIMAALWAKVQFENPNFDVDQLLLLDIDCFRICLAYSWDIHVLIHSCSYTLEQRDSSLPYRFYD